MCEIDYSDISKAIVKTSLRVRPKEKVVIYGREDTLHLCELIGIECCKIGAFPFISVRSDGYLLHRLLDTPLDSLKQTPLHELSLVQNSDVIIVTHLQPEDPSILDRVCEERVSAEKLGFKQIAQMISPKFGKRWLFMDCPTAEQARVYGVDFGKYSRTFWRAVGVDHQKTYELAQRLRKTLRDAKIVTITSARGTKIAINIRNSAIFVDDGIVSEEDIAEGANGENLPSGEVFLLPNLKGTNGRVVFDLAFHKGQKIENLGIEFRDGRAIPMGAESGFELFENVLASASGDKDFLAEFGLGLNPEIKEAIGFSLLDEKMLGTVHLALGDNLALGGRLDSDLHWDLLILRPTVEAEGVTLIVDGTVAV